MLTDRISQKKDISPLHRISQAEFPNMLDKKWQKQFS